MTIRKTDQLTFTRFISAFAILWVHFNAGTYFYNQKIDEILFPFFPVTYFFLLSGFVLGIAYYDRFEKNSKNRVSVKKYYLLRILRIYPVYFLALILELSYLFLYQKSQLPDLKTLLLNITLLQSWFIVRAINFPSWSLSCEVFYYLLFPIILTQVKKLNNELLISFIVGIWIIQQIAFYVLFDIDNLELGIKFHPILHLPTFVSGVLLAVFYTRNADYLTKILTPFNNTLLIFILANIFFNKSIFHFETLQVPFFLFFIILICVPNNFYAKYFNNEYFIYLGLMSYCVYILQAPIALYADNLFGKLHIINHSFRFIIFIFLVLTISGFCYFLYEKPIYRRFAKLIA